MDGEIVDGVTYDSKCRLMLKRLISDDTGAAIDNV